MNNENKVAYNVAGAVIGALLAAVAIFSIVQVQSSAQTPQEHTRLISYDS